ncbi:MAG: hypothetical protein QOG03_516 [Actinomycetota bacterium]|jgi:hypothetical protein|nr:hypothetical protein [Actinomycetota bacterium]
MPDVRFDRWYRYDELTTLLHAFADEHPDLVELESIGKSYEERDIWLLTITQRAGRPHTEKPALWVEASIHATELTGTAAALHLINRLVTGYGNDKKVTEALDTRCFYVVPRLNPDGAEAALSDPPRIQRSSSRPWPRTDQQDGLRVEDADGDGRILTMRIPDSNGNWKRHPDDPRLLVARDPDEYGGDPDAGDVYYRLLPEGRIQNYDGILVKMAPPLRGLDINRNFPVDWRPEGEQMGAGPFPTSEPEIRAEVEAITQRPNICAFIAYHTQSGVHLRPSSMYADDQMPTFDLRTFKAIGKRATEITGYPAASVFHDFKYDPKDVITGVADDWAYEHLGIHGWTTEFWSVLRAAGITDFKFIDWYLDHPIDDDLKLLKWSDETINGEGYVDWYPFEHPELGSVELGGWNSLRFHRNPPLELLEKEIAPHAEWAIFHLLISPRLVAHSFRVEPVGSGTWRLTAVVHNDGWLPTNVTQKALDKKTVRPIEAELTLPDGVELVGGERRVELGQLQGRALKNAMMGGGADPTADRAKVEWVVKATGVHEIPVEIRHQRAGVVRFSFPLNQ